MRLISRAVNASINTVAKLLVDADEICITYHDTAVRRVKARRVQCDEIWPFNYMKQKNVASAKAVSEYWITSGEGRKARMEVGRPQADGKLIIAYEFSDARVADVALSFMDDLRSRLATRLQSTAGGLRSYLVAVKEAFGDDIDYAQFVKLYGGVPESAKGRL